MWEDYKLHACNIEDLIKPLVGAHWHLSKIMGVEGNYPKIVKIKICHPTVYSLFLVGYSSQLWDVTSASARPYIYVRVYLYQSAVKNGKRRRCKWKPVGVQSKRRAEDSIRHYGARGAQQLAWKSQQERHKTPYSSRPRRPFCLSQLSHRLCCRWRHRPFRTLRQIQLLFIHCRYSPR